MFWIVATALLSILAIFLCWKLYKFAQIIMVFEDNLSLSLESLIQADDALKNVLELKLFFDSKEIYQIVTHAVETVKYAKSNINVSAARFVEMSKKKYILYTDPEDEEIANELNKISEEDRIRAAVQVPRFPIQERREGTVAHVKR